MIRVTIFQHVIRVTIFQHAISMRNVIVCSYKLIETKRIYMIKVKETLPCDDTYVSSKLLSCKQRSYLSFLEVSRFSIASFTSSDLIYKVEKKLLIKKLTLHRKYKLSLYQNQNQTYYKVGKILPNHLSKRNILLFSANTPPFVSIH